LRRSIWLLGGPLAIEIIHLHISRYVVADTTAITESSKSKTVIHSVKLLMLCLPFKTVGRPKVRWLLLQDGLPFPRLQIACSFVIEKEKLSLSSGLARAGWVPLFMMAVIEEGTSGKLAT
jgi:hypothetical protein